MDGVIEGFEMLILDSPALTPASGGTAMSINMHNAILGLGLNRSSGLLW